ncbi:MAG: hypothetical protein JRI58_14090 [Deltaproteobacteria bacterium]|nr:hypothetical protein [Deltaproteobacteria bacterium]
MSKRFRFSNEDIDRLRDALKPYEKAHVDTFIARLELLCAIKPKLNTLKEMRDHREKLKTINNHFKATLKDLKKICSKNFSLLPQAKIADTKDFSSLNTIVKSVDLIVEVYGPLKQLADIIRNTERQLEVIKPGRGHPRADTQGLVREIKEMFEKHLGEASSYEYGPFSDVVRITLEILDLPSKDPSRPIRRAVKST